MTTVGRTGGIRPSLSAEELLSAVPGLDEAARVETDTLATLPGASLEVRDLLGALQWARAHVLAGASGAVVVQGTDNIEETAYLLDLYWDLPEPLVVTGAMRSPQVAGADGPANLLASVLVAKDPESRDLGVLVVMNDQIHAASRVRKTRASGTDAFTSPSFGPLGYLEEGRPVIANRLARWPSLRLPSVVTETRVALVETHLGDRGTLLDLVSQASFDGVVLAGFGVGHVSSALAECVAQAADRIPVVLASRTGSGTSYQKTYDFQGSESDLIAKGAIGAGWLDPRKARILLSCLLSANETREDIRSEFARRGGNPGAYKMFDDYVEDLQV